MYINPEEKYLDYLKLPSTEYVMRRKYNTAMQRKLGYTSHVFVKQQIQMCFLFKYVLIISQLP